MLRRNFHKVKVLEQDLGAAHSSREKDRLDRGEAAGVELGIRVRVLAIRRVFTRIARVIVEVLAS